MKTSALLASAVALAVASPLAFAHQTGDLILRAGAAMVAPQTDSGRVETDVTGKLPGTKVTLNDNTQLGLTLSYMVTDNLGVELLAATPFKHRIGLKGFGGLGLPQLDGKFADAKHLPPTVSVQYFPLASTSAWQPYVGAGLNYTTFLEANLTRERKDQGFSKLKLSDSWGLALQVGSDFKLTDNLLLNVAVWRMDINTKATARHDVFGKVKVDVDVDPWVYMVGVGYKF